MSKSSILVTVLFVAAGGAVLAALPPDGFFSSDEGVKFIQLRSLAANGFASSSIVWPGDELGLDRRYAVVERFVELRGGRLYSPHPLLFALASAPGWLLFGYRGLYLLPLLAGGAAVALTTALARGFGVRRPWLAGAVVAFASPIFFYSLCYWEHAPAVALWLGGFALARRRSAARLLAAGVLWGGGAALRPEFYWLAAWSVAALFIFHKGERLRTAAPPAAAFAITVVGLEVLMWAAWGQPAFMRFGANAAYGGPGGGAGLAFALAHSILPLEPWYFAAGAAAAFALAAAAFRWRPALYGAAAAAAVLTLRYATFFGGYATPLAASFPAAFGLFVLARPEARRLFASISATEKSLYVSALGFAATLFLVVPDTSGFAWGSRFLLYVLPAGALALARAAGGPGRERWVRVGVAGLFVVASAAVQLFGLNRLRAEKEGHGALVAALASREARPILVNSWYLPAYAAPLYDERPFIIIKEVAALREVREALAGRGVRRAYFLTELPVAPAEREDYVLGLTTTLGRDFDVVDLRPVAEGRGAYVLPYCLYDLVIPAAGK